MISELLLNCIQLSTLVTGIDKSRDHLLVSDPHSSLDIYK